MMKNMKQIYLLVFILIAGIMFSASSCSDSPPEPEIKKPVLTIIFNHSNDDEPLTFDQSNYINQAGNPYLINEIQYFITDLIFRYNDGSDVAANNWEPFHYVDTDLEYSMNWIVPDTIREGTITGISFRLGFRDEVNESFMFVNPPQRDMFWPEYLGGGYHYMKLNGKWEPQESTYPNLPFDYDNQGVITEFIDNSMPFEFDNISFEMKNGDTTVLAITMHVENWFKNPHEYDHDVWGGYIMNNQEAMQVAVDNSHDVFSVAVEEQP
jgi:hypothetical protein